MTVGQRRCRKITGEPCAEVDAPEALFARKNSGIEEIPHDGRHGWLRLTPGKAVSWDFREPAALQSENASVELPRRRP